MSKGVSWLLERTGDDQVRDAIVVVAEQAPQHLLGVLE